MDTIKKSNLEEWDDAIREGLTQIFSTQDDLEGIAGVADCMGMEESVKDAFKQIEIEVHNLLDQVALLDDMVEGKETEFVRLDNGEYATVFADNPDDEVS